MFALRVLPALVCVLLYASATAAQTPPGHDRMEPTAVTLTTDSGRVRFTSPGPALDWRLEVVNAHNDIIFDTGVVNGTDLEWPLVDAQGQPIESGTYHYTLTIQADQATLRVQRGEWQIERLNSVYQMSALSADSTGGVILSATDAVPQPATAAPMGALSQSFRRSLGTVTFIQPLISGSGTTNAMTKWTDGPSGVVGDSNVAEANGSVVIGNGSFYGNLHIFGAAGSDVYAGMGPNLITGPGFNYGYAGGTFGRSAGFFNVRPDASALPPNPSLRFMTGNVERVIITNTGNVGIGTSNPFAKLHAVAGSGNAVYGVSGTSVGISGFSSSGSGVVGLSISGNGVVGASTMGTAGYFDGNVEVTGGVGVGVSGSTAARVHAVASGFATAVHGVSTSGSAVIGASHSGTGVTGMSSLGDAGYFLGNVTVTGTLTKGGGAFRIDHPLDPEHKYLLHSFVESPDMLNVYNGNVRLDARGEAVVILPAWFQALNHDFRYQLTPIGAPGPNLYVAAEVAENRFTIAGGAPGGKVSWQVTGIRQDAWANAHRIPVEQDKTEADRVPPPPSGAPYRKH